MSRKPSGYVIVVQESTMSADAGMVYLIAKCISEEQQRSVISMLPLFL